VLEATIAQALFTAALAAIFGGFLFWGLKTGQFRDTEESKYHIVDEPELAPREGSDDE
jgi:nitrogen fixation-related uncharacterized protein